VNPLVSILIPAYNAERSLALTLESTLAQTWTRKEVIVVDDGSKDATVAVARRYESPTVRVLSQPNQGAAAARNAAFAASQGDFIQWLDADDLLSTNKIAAQMDALRDAGPRTLASAGWAYFRSRPDAARFVPTPLWESLDPVEWMTRKWEHNLHMQTATWLVSRELSAAAGPWDSRLLGDDDGEYFARVVMRSDGIRFVEGARVYYRISDGARLSYIGRSHAKMDAQFLGMEMQIGYLRSLADTARVRRACITYLETWLAHFHPNRPDIVERAQALAGALGGQLRMPTLSWKYAWIKRLFGWEAAKQTRIRYNESKTSLLNWLDGRHLRLRGGSIDPKRL
jgi:glycosyltransferase involved in cell wall biosynthesis